MCTINFMLMICTTTVPFIHQIGVLKSNQTTIILNQNSKNETLVIAPGEEISIARLLSSSVQSSNRNLGVLFDSPLSLERHSRELIKVCFYHLKNIEH